MQFIQLYIKLVIKIEGGYMEKRTAKEMQDFLKANYVTCNHCGYNNEKARLRQYGTCLNCGKILDEKMYFMIEMMKKLKANSRRKG